MRQSDDALASLCHGTLEVCGSVGCLAVGSQTNPSLFQEGYVSASATGGRSWLPAALPASGSFQGLDQSGASRQGSRRIAVGTRGYLPRRPVGGALNGPTRVSLVKG